MPMTNSFGFQVDSGTFSRDLRPGAGPRRPAGFAERRRQSEAAGKLRGLGFAYHIKGTGGSPEENVDIRFEPDGTVSLITGTQHIGQGHETTFPQILAHRLGVAERTHPAPPGRHRPDRRGRRPRQLARDLHGRHGDVARLGRDHRQGHGARRRRAGGGRGRHPLRGRTLRRLGHRPRHRPSRSRRARARRRASRSTPIMRGSAST